MTSSGERRLGGWSLLRHWRTKAVVQKALSSVPSGGRVNYRLQRHVTHGVPISGERLRRALLSARAHLEAYRRHAEPPSGLADARFFEFGAGWDLHVALTLFALGVGTQVVVDRTAHARPDLVKDVMTRLAQDDSLSGEASARLRAAGERATRSGGVREMAAEFGITYLAPADARATGLSADSVDCVTSTSTLEHIPRSDIEPILRECRRMLRPGGVASFVIDYSDHYSHFDASITPFNFLGYSDRRWRLYNSSLQFQNRMRHSEYVRLFDLAGFDVVDQTPSVDARRLEELRSVPLAAEFSDFEELDLATTGAHVVLRRPS